MELLIVTLASGLAGFVDAIVGGGGLILVPALFAAFPAAPPATLAVQQRLWALAHEAARWPGVSEVLPGMNNLTLLFDPEHNLEERILSEQFMV